MRLLAEVHAIADARRRRTVLLSLAAAAAVFLAVLIPAWPVLERAVTGRQPSVPPVVSQELVTEFFPLTYSNVPARNGYVVRIQVPRTALAAFGASLESGDSPTVLADVVVGDDGLARAVRFVQIVNSDRQEQMP